MGTGAKRDDEKNDVGTYTEVAPLLSTVWMETYSRVFSPTTRITVKDEEDNGETGYIWADDIEMKDIREATRQ